MGIYTTFYYGVTIPNPAGPVGAELETAARKAGYYSAMVRDSEYISLVIPESRYDHGLSNFDVLGSGNKIMVWSMKPLNVNDNSFLKVNRGEHEIDQRFIDTFNRFLRKYHITETPHWFVYECDTLSL